MAGSSSGCTIRNERVSPLTYELIDPDEQIGSLDFRFVERFLQATRRTELGWHYLTDIAWIYGKVKNWPRSWRVLDAGGGGGALQFLLAELGFNVTNVDLLFPADPPRPVAKRYRFTFKRLPNFQESAYMGHLRSFAQHRRLPFRRWYRRLRAATYNARHDRWRREAGLLKQSIGSIEWIVGNLCDLSEIPSGSFDAVVSLSSLEHIPLKQLHSALTEIARVLKPQASWAVTTSATELPETWLHEPSQGWCYSIADLESRFGAVRSREQHPCRLLAQYRSCDCLRERLARFYRKSGNNGMPWGIWDPKYIPVGLSR